MKKKAAAVLLLVSMPAAFGSNLVMPKDLVEFANRNSCTQIHHFYDRPGMVNPPYVYGYLQGSAEASAVLWCRKKRPDEKPYELLIISRRPAMNADCPAKIAWWNYPGGLSLDRRTKQSLAYFHYVNNPNEQGPANTQTTGTTIVSDYDGVSVRFYCHSGRWLYRIAE